MFVSFSSNLKKAYLFPVICFEAPQSTSHPTPKTVLVERHDTMAKVVLSLVVNSSTPEASVLPANSAVVVVPPLLIGIEERG